MVTVAFLNLFVNSIFSLAAGLVVVSFFLWLFKVGTGSWKVFLLSLPLLKVVLDFMRGVPDGSVLWTTIDPFSLPPHHHILRIGGGFNFFGPTLEAAFSVKNVDGNEFMTSIGDHLAIWLNRTYGETALNVMLGVVIFTAFFLVVLRVTKAVRFERLRRIDRRQAQGLTALKVNGRRVDVYISSTSLGSPFTGGITHPYICIPQEVYDRLSAEEIEAVVAHEVGHIRHWDLCFTLLIQLVGDVFWFVPGYRWLSKKTDQLREIVADQWAVTSGADPLHLASALIKLKELPDMLEQNVHYSAFFREKSLLKYRVERLLENLNEDTGRFGWRHKWLRLAISIWIVGAVMTATLGGNKIATSSINLEWIEQLKGSVVK